MYKYHSDVDSMLLYNRLKMLITGREIFSFKSRSRNKTCQVGLSYVYILSGFKFHCSASRHNNRLSSSQYYR